MSPLAIKRLLLLSAACALSAGAAAHAETITWANWTSSVNNGAAAGSATGTIALGSGVTVTYNGQIGGLEDDTNWGPASTYAGGNVSNAPSSANGQEIWMTGGQSYTETITFSQAVTDPTMSFWSLGGGGNVTAEYDFNNPFTIQACGPSNNLGGTCITKSGNKLYGDEGNGTIQFAGTYTSLSFTTPVYEHWWDMTVGAAALAPVTPPPAVTPEPSSLLLLGTGLAGIGGVLRRRMFAA